MPPNSSNPPSRHHYVPEFLLQGWTDEDGLLWRYAPVYHGQTGERVAGKGWQRLAPAALGYEKNLYSVEGLPAEHAQTVEEQFMAPLDSQAADAHQELLAGRAHEMTQAQRSAWSRYLMSQWFRTPEGLRLFKEVMGYVLEDQNTKLAELYADKRHAGTPDNFEDFLQYAVPSFGEQITMSVLCRMMDDRGRGFRINNMFWTVRRTSCSRSLLVSDASVDQSGAGLFTEKGYIALPISPKHIFVAASAYEFTRAIMTLSDHDIVSRMNRATVGQARIFVAATDKSQARFVEERFGSEDHRTIIGTVAQQYRNRSIS